MKIVETYLVWYMASLCKIYKTESSCGAIMWAMKEGKEINEVSENFAKDLIDNTDKIYTKIN